MLTSTLQLPSTRFKVPPSKDQKIQMKVAWRVQVQLELLGFTSRARRLLAEGSRPLGPKKCAQKGNKCLLVLEGGVLKHAERHYLPVEVATWKVQNVLHPNVSLLPAFTLVFVRWYLRCLKAFLGGCWVSTG